MLAVDRLALSRLAPSRVACGMACLLSIMALSVTVARAQTYPRQPIRTIVPFTPGGGTDILTRLLTNKISALTGWAFVVDNKPGAAGNIGMDAVVKAKPDGYTIGMGQTANLAVNPTLYPKMPYDPLTQVTPVALVASQPVILVVRQDSPYRTLADLVSAAKAKPGSLSMASAGSGTIQHLAGELFAQRAGIKFLHVPYRGSAPALTDTLGGQTDLSFTNPPSALTMLKGGKMRALAITSAHRLPLFPDVPTVDESGYPGFEAGDWKGMVTPIGVPAPVIERLNAEANRALRDPEMIKRLHDEGSDAMGGTPEDFGQFLKTEHARWREIVHATGAQPE
jgi:tripartite-type tricarboxylate transporter receptor subunit TctC